jgi:serine/threonine protein kinase
MFVQVLLACLYLQSKKLVHRDIKDENIVVDASYHLKLIDFGSASQIPIEKEDFFRRYNGTPHFAAPEIVSGHHYQGPQAEVWYLYINLGRLAFYCILFFLAKTHSKEIMILERIMERSYRQNQSRMVF